MAAISPPEGGGAPGLLPELTLAVSDSGGVEPSTLRLERAGQPFAASCAFADGLAHCLPATAFTNHEAVALTARVADRAGNQASTTWSFTVDTSLDTTPAVISLAAPAPGFTTNAASIRFLGSVSEPASLTLDGTPVALTAARTFDHGSVALASGLNNLLRAVDAGGNVTELAVQVVGDRTLGSTLIPAAVTVTADGVSRAGITGSAGAVSPLEPGSVIVAVHRSLAPQWIWQRPAQLVRRHDSRLADRRRPPARTRRRRQQRSRRLLPGRGQPAAAP